MLKMRYLGLMAGVISLFIVAHASDSKWAFKTKDLEFPQTALDAALKFRNIALNQLGDQKRKRALEDLYVREKLLATNTNLSAEQQAELDIQLAEFRKAKLADLALQQLGTKDLPDFLPRAQELYEARKDKQYSFPERLRVNILEVEPLPDKMAEAQQQLNQVKQEINTGKIDFKKALLQYGTNPTRTLNGGDSYWFSAAQKAKVFYEAANKLSQAQPLSEIFTMDGKAYLLQFVGRKPAEVENFDFVKNELLNELKAAYIAELQEKLINQWRETFRKEAEINPALLQEASM
jgi:hypothetical protein